MLMVLARKTSADIVGLPAYTPAYWAPIFTLIVGMLGIISQIAINYFSEKRRYELEYNKIYKSALYNFYIPLLSLVRQYKSYRSLLSVDDNFSLLSGNCIGDSDMYKVFAELKGVYMKLYSLVQESYVPTNKNLDQEINAFFQHIISIICVWESGCSIEMARLLVGDEYINGYDCNNLETYLVNLLLSDNI